MSFKQIFGIASIHNICNVPSEPERAAETRKARCSIHLNLKEDEYERECDSAGIAADFAIQLNRNPGSNRGIHSPSNSIIMCSILNLLCNCASLASFHNPPSTVQLSCLSNKIFHALHEFQEEER